MYARKTKHNISLHLLFDYVTQNLNLPRILLPRQPQTINNNNFLKVVSVHMSEKLKQNRRQDHIKFERSLVFSLIFFITTSVWGMRPNILKFQKSLSLIILITEVDHSITMVFTDVRFQNHDFCPEFSSKCQFSRAKNKAPFP